MLAVILEPTNRCNRDCLHCLRNKAEPPGDLPLDTAGTILAQARDLSLKSVCLTGGEVAVYPHLEELVRMIVDYGFRFSVVTNGFRFEERLLPLLSEPRIKKKSDGVCFSLDGARASTHDALRGGGSFKEVMEAASLCKLHNISMSLKSAITNFNKGELSELALLGATLEATDHSFIYLFPTPRALEEGVMPSPDELDRICSWIIAGLAKTVRGRVAVEGFLHRTVTFLCGNIYEGISFDFQGNLVFCCNLSHMNEGEDILPRPGKEVLGNVRDISLKEGIIKHFRMVAQLMEARLEDQDNLSGVSYNPCYWCVKHFGKSEWLKNYPESPWAAGVVGGH